MICYELNADGKVRAIETPVSRDDYPEGRLTTILPKSSGYYYGRMFDSKMVFDNASTAIFPVPNIEGDITENMISAISSSDISDRISYTVEGYALSASDTRLKALLVYGGATSTIPKEENLATIVSVSHTLDEKDAEVYTASVLVEGVAKEFVLDDEISGIASPADFKPGDSFRYGTNAEGKIHMVDMVYTAKDGWRLTILPTQALSKITMQCRRATTPPLRL